MSTQKLNNYSYLAKFAVDVHKGYNAVMKVLSYFKMLLLY